MSYFKVLFVIIGLSLLIEGIPASKNSKLIKYSKYLMDMSKSTRAGEPECTEKCLDCLFMLNNHTGEIEATCVAYYIPGDQENYCWAKYIVIRCLKEYARKNCKQCDQFNATAKYIEDYISYIENEECKGYPSNPCNSESTTTSISVSSLSTDPVSTTTSNSISTTPISSSENLFNNIFLQFLLITLIISLNF